MMANAAKIIDVQSSDGCKVCEKSNESAVLNCGHTIPFIVVEGNAVDLLLSISYRLVIKN